MDNKYTRTLGIAISIYRKSMYGLAWLQEHGAPSSERDLICSIRATVRLVLPLPPCLRILLASDRSRSQDSGTVPVAVHYRGSAASCSCRNALFIEHLRRQIDIATRVAAMPLDARARERVPLLALHRLTCGNTACKWTSGCCSSTSDERRPGRTPRRCKCRFDSVKRERTAVRKGHANHRPPIPVARAGLWSANYDNYRDRYFHDRVSSYARFQLRGIVSSSVSFLSRCNL